jgi:NTP pyrophosphatase (non-canonical NTP hydrolase)
MSFDDLDAERDLTRDERQGKLVSWAEQAFGREQSTSIPQRGLRLLEEAIEAFQASGGDEAMAHKLVTFVFARPPGTVGQELGGVAVTVLLLAAAAGLSADEEECREMHRVLNKPVKEFTERNANKNAAGFLVDAVETRDPLIVEVPTALTRIDVQLKNDSAVMDSAGTCCGNSGARHEINGTF